MGGGRTIEVPLSEADRQAMIDALRAEMQDSYDYMTLHEVASILGYGSTQMVKRHLEQAGYVVTCRYVRATGKQTNTVTIADARAFIESRRGK